MKKVLLAIMSIALFASCCSVPQEVKDAFAADFPTASDAVWDCDDDSYEVSYVVDGVRYETEYDKLGNKMATDDPQPSTCSHGHGTCSGDHQGHNHGTCEGNHEHSTCKDSTACTGEHHHHDHAACDGNHDHSACKDSTACTGEHKHDKTTCTGNHENCSHK
ncbi:MAG: hypothetical protein IKT29_02195 [Flavobacteriales bacterium]|nr:hypothetical protein [Flavobacteriales bacterium]